MKKILSILTLVVSLTATCVTPVFAAGTLTLAGSSEDANVGDEIIVSATMDTSNGIKSLGLKIAFDVDDFELGVSSASKAVQTEYSEYIGTEDYPTLDSVTLDILGRKSYVDDAYATTYSGYGNKNLGNATIDYEIKDGKCYVAFGYALSSAIGTLKATKDMSVAGVVLKAKTNDKKASIITIEEATYSGSDGVDTKCSTTNTLAINLNGYKPSTSTPAKEGLTQDDGDKTFYTPEAVEFTGDSITVKVTNDKVTDTKIEETLEKAGSVLGGKTKLLPIIKYTPSDALKDSTFTIEIGDKTYTYAIAE